MLTKQVQLDILDLDRLDACELSDNFEENVLKIREFEEEGCHSYDDCIEVAKAYLELGEYLKMMDLSNSPLVN